MKQNHELQRELLLKIENCENINGIGFVNKKMALAAMTSEEDLQNFEDITDKVEYNFGLLEQRGFVRYTGVNSYRYYNLTALGHDYLDAIKNDSVWAQTKIAVAETGGSATLEIVKALALGFVKQKLEKHTGIEL